MNVDPGPSGPPATRGQVDARIWQMSQAMGWGDGVGSMSQRQHPCPVCGVGAGQPCRRPSHRGGIGWVAIAGFHPSRGEDTCR